MIEIFSTNIHDPGTARDMIDRIHLAVPGCQASIDLDDCDRVLRVERMTGFDAGLVIGLLAESGYRASVLPDEAPPPFDIDNLLKSA